MPSEGEVPFLLALMLLRLTLPTRILCVGDVEMLALLGAQI